MTDSLTNTPSSSSLPPSTESALHHAIARRAADAPHAAVLVGPGDDCAVLAPNSLPLLVSVDHLIERRHFTPDTPLDAIAHKAVARSVSDLAACAATPLWSLATVAFPHAYPHAHELCAALQSAALRLRCPIVGGDIATLPLSPIPTSQLLPPSPGPAPAAFANTPALVITVTAAGSAHPSRGPVLRRGAQPADLVFVTGNLGNSFHSGRHLAFTPRTAEAAFLADRLGPALHAMIDLSDGMGRDAARLARASGVRIELDESAIPVHPDALVHRTALEALADGEDYELLFTADPAAAASLAARPSLSPGDSFLCPRTATPITCIGFARAPDIAQPLVALRRAAGVVTDISALGYEHSLTP